MNHPSASATAGAREWALVMRLLLSTWQTEKLDELDGLVRKIAANVSSSLLDDEAGEVRRGTAVDAEGKLEEVGEEDDKIYAQANRMK